MVDVTKCGVVTVLGLKKCGSSQIRKSFAEKHWEFQQFNDRTQRYVTAFRNPAHRLVSCWNHLVRPRHEVPVDPSHASKEKFGPHVPFFDWVDWIIEQDPETMNAHMRPQTYELADVLRDTDGLIWVGQLERMQELAKGPLTKWLKWSIAMPDKRRHAYYGRWPDYYTTNLLREVRRCFATDYKLWMGLYGNGCEVFNTGQLSRMLDLTNGRDCVTM